MQVGVRPPRAALARHQSEKCAGAPALVLVLVGCGNAPLTDQTLLKDPGAPVMMSVWSSAGQGGPRGGHRFGRDTVFVRGARQSEGGVPEERLWAIDRASRRVTSRSLRDVELLRVDPLISMYRDEERGQAFVARFDDSLRTIWQSDPICFSVPLYLSGPLVIVPQAPMSEYVGLDPEDGHVVFRVRSLRADFMGDVAEAESFVALPTEDRATLVDSATGETSGVVDAPVGQWEVVGDRLLVASAQAVTAYDREGRQVWTERGDFPAPMGRTAPGTCRSCEPVSAPRALVFDRERGLLALDPDGHVQWVTALPDERYRRPGFLVEGRVLLGPEGGPTLILDSSSGEQVFACEAPCQIRDQDARAFLVSSDDEGDERGAALRLFTIEGGPRWQRALGEELSIAHGGAVLLDELVAVCPASGPVTFLDRADGHLVSTQPLPSAPEDQRSGSAYCRLQADGDLLVAERERGVAVFGPRLKDRAPEGSADASEALTEVGEDEAAAEEEERPFYDVPTLAPPPEGASEALASGRAAYLEARAAFRAGRFEEAASGFLGAYRAFRAAEDNEVWRLGFECCYDARVSADRSGDRTVYRRLLRSLSGAADSNCRGIVERAPPPL